MNADSHHNHALRNPDTVPLDPTQEVPLGFRLPGLYNPAGSDRLHGLVSVTASYGMANAALVSLPDAFVHVASVPHGYALRPLPPAEGVKLPKMRYAETREQCFRTAGNFRLEF